MGVIATRVMPPVRFAKTFTLTWIMGITHHSLIDRKISRKVSRRISKRVSKKISREFNREINRRRLVKRD